MASAGMVFLPFFVLDATFTTIVRPHPLRTPLYMQETLNARAQCIEISIHKRDGHTYIHTDAKRDASRISCLALRRSAIKGDVM